MVLAQVKDSMKVWPTRVKGFDVLPVLGPSSSEITVLDTFHVASAERSVPQHASPVRERFTTSTSRWLDQMRSRIERELAKLPSTPLYEARVREEARIDLELRSRREAHDRKSITPIPIPIPIPIPSPVPIKVPAPIAGRYTPLPKHAARIIGEALEGEEEDAVLISKFNIDFCLRDLLTLRSPQWLNDEVINFYLQAIAERAASTPAMPTSVPLPSVHVFSSFFFPKLRDRGYDAVRTSTRRLATSVLTRDLILLPIHLGMHWCLAAIDFPLKTISYYDSLHGSNPACIAALKNWLACESRDKLSREFDFAGWSESSPKDIPAQQNGYDCGVFSLVYAEHLSRRAPFTFSQKDMPYWRDRISFEIITGKLLDSFAAPETSKSL